MRILLRKVELDYPSLLKAVEAMPEADRMNKAELDEALEELRQKSWIIRRGAGDTVSYKANLRRKAKSSLSGSMWSMLENKIDDQKSPPKE